MSSSEPRDRRRQWIAAAVIAAGVAVHGVVQMAPSWERVRTNPSAADFASYYYAVEVARLGGDPYSAKELSKLARDEKTRRVVQPYFYPPPFLLSVAWAPAWPLGEAFKIMFWVNEVLLGACLWVLHRSFRVAPWAIAVLLATWSPIPDNAWMGQANLIALLPALVGLAIAPRRPVVGGVLVGAAAMFKMSPALFLLYWALRRNWRAVFAAMGTAVALSVAALPLVDLATQVRFYREVLPGFARGDYHDLTVALNIPANHSIPDLFNHAWPGPTPTSMSDLAIAWSRVVNLGMLAAWAWWFRRAPSSPGQPSAADDALPLGVLTIAMTIIPAYTYEHHLVFLLLPVTALATAAARARPAWAWLAATAVAWFAVGWPLKWLNDARRDWPAWDAAFRESKFIGLVAMMLLLAALWGQRARARG